MKVSIMQVLEKDLAIFGFFIALGRSTRSFLLANGFDTLDDPLEDFIRYDICDMLFLILEYQVSYSFRNLIMLVAFGLGLLVLH